MRYIAWSLVAAFLIAVGLWPPLATFIGSLLWAVLVLGMHGAALLLAQTAVQLALAAALGVHLYRNRRTA